VWPACRRAVLSRASANPSTVDSVAAAQSAGGVVKHRKQADRLPQQMTAPTVAPVETLRQIKNAMKTELPGVSVLRGLFWRNIAIWTASVR